MIRQNPATGKTRPIWGGPQIGLVREGIVNIVR